MFDGARPSSLVLEDTPLLSQPPLTADARPMEITTVPAGTYVIVLDMDDQSRSYFRVIWPCGEHTFVGWVNATAIDYSTRRVNPKPAPPGCAIPLATVDSLEDEWISTVDGRIAVVADLYRDRGGSVYPLSFYYLTRNGRALRDKERKFTTAGPFLINGVVTGADVSAGHTIGFALDTSSDERLHFFGTIYSIPIRCGIWPLLNQDYFYTNLNSDFLLVDMREVLGDVFIEQTGLIDSSHSTEMFSQDIVVRREFRHSITLRINPNANLDRRNVEDRILTAYGLPGALGEKVCVIPAHVPAGRVYQYDIEWTQVLREGNIEEGQVAGQGNIMGTYSIVVDLQCQVVGTTEIR